MQRTDYLIAQRCNGRVLDLGCRDGRRSLLIDMLGSDVLGVDEDRKQLSVAQERAKACCLDHCHFKCIDDNWIDNQRFDTIVVSSSSAGMERTLLGPVDRVLELNGQIILAIPNSTHLLGDRNLSIPSLKTLRERFSSLFPVVEDIQDDFTEWRISVFRRSAEMGAEKSGSTRSISNATSLPKVSIIMSTYNRAQMIHNAIDSVLNQTYANIELVVVNDGSTDGTREILDTYGSRLTAIHKPKNEGISVATNTGLATASGDFVQRFDDDDIMFPRKIECQVRKFGTNPALGLVYAAAYVQFSLRDEKWFRYMGRFIPLSEYAFVPSIEVLNSATLVKKQCMDEIGFFDTQLKGMAECDRFIRIMARYEYEFMPVPAVLYMKHGGNHTMKRRELIKESSQKIHESMVDQVDIDDLFKDIANIEDEDERRKQYSLVFLRRGRYGSAKGCYESACKDFERALTLAPENRAAKKYLKEAREALSKQDMQEQPDGQSG